jgi:hypothetical protein
VPAGYDQADGRQFGSSAIQVSLKKCGMNVAFQMIDRQQGLSKRFGERFPVSDSDEERAHESGSLGNADGVHFIEAQPGVGQGFTHHGNDLAQMLARSELGNHTTVSAVNIDLRSHHARKNAAAIDDDGSSGFVAGRLDAENAHTGCFVWRHFDEIPC